MKKAVCPFCGKKAERFIMFHGDVVGCQFCGIHTKQKNADRIRSMTDEELAELLEQVRVSCGFAMGGRDCRPNCADCWLDWLREEANG